MQVNHILLIGGGIWGGNILRDLIKLGAKVSVVETNPQRTKTLLGMGATRVLAALPASNQNFNGVIVATPSTTHRQVLEAAKIYELPIFVEKPITTNLEDAQALESWGHGRIFLMHIWRYHAGILGLAAIAESKELGKVLGIRSTRANWTSPRKDTDTVWNLGPHDLTLAKTILGYIPTPRSASIEYHNGIARGMVASLGREPYLTLEVSNRYERKIREVRLHCENGVAVLENEKVDYITLNHGNAACPPEQMVFERRQFSGPSPLTSELQEFLTFINGGPEPRCSLADGLEVVQTLTKLEQLART